MAKKRKSEYLTAIMTSVLVTILLCTSFSGSDDRTVLTTAERFFFQNDVQQCSNMIDSHPWVDAALWSRAGLIRELCDSGWSIDCPVMMADGYRTFTSAVSIAFSGVFNPGDSVRVTVPVPAVLPWQTPLGVPDVLFTGISGLAEVSGGWISVAGVSEGVFSITVSQQVEVDPPAYVGARAHGSEEAMVPFPGEDPFLDSCLNTDAFWAGGDAVYMESVSLAAGTPNPMELLQRVIDFVSGYYRDSFPVTEQILLYPVSELAIQNKMFNSFTGAAAGAAILRRWQIPALAIPGYWNGVGLSGFALAAFIKPFGWMIVSPVPRGFTALGSMKPPDVKSWFNGVPGVSCHAEYLGEDGFWYAVPVNTPEFTHCVEISSQ
jgi:hypothetical protein